MLKYKTVATEDDPVFKAAFWEWYDNLPEIAKKEYMYNRYDVSEEYFREFFYKK